jgi:hypothetical protein
VPRSFTIKAGTQVDYELAFHPKGRVLLIFMGSTVTKASAVAAQAAVRCFLAAEGPCSIIANLSGVEREELPGDFIRSLARTPSAIASGEWLILVAPQNVMYGLCRMFHLWRDEAENHKIVRTLDEGCALLGVKPEDFQVVGFAATAGGSLL